MSVQRLTNLGNPLFSKIESVKQKPDCAPQVSYKILDQDDVFKYHSSASKAARVGWLLFSILIFPVGLIRLIGKTINHFSTKKLLLPAIERDKALLDNHRIAHLANSFTAQRSSRITIETADHVKLDTMMISHPDQENKDISERKYIIFFNGNDGTYEGGLSSLMKISDETGANVYCGNYRGVGYSEGFPTGYQDLVMDGEAMVQFLLKQGVRPENILIHGWSLGAGVGAHVAALHQDKGHEIHFCGDRSFASMVMEVKELSRSIRNEMRNTCLGNFLKGTLALLTPVVLGLIKVLGWNFQTLDCYKKIQGHKFIIYHREDKTIPYAASLFTKFKESKMSSADIKAKLERKKAKLEGRERNIEEAFKKTYHPENFVKLNDEYWENVHCIHIHESLNFNEYVRQVGLALNPTCYQ